MSVRVLPDTGARVETGVVQFGDDWPGVFVRGDNAGGYALALRSVLDGRSDDVFARGACWGLLELLQSSDTRAVLAQEEK